MYALPNSPASSSLRFLGDFFLDRQEDLPNLLEFANRERIPTVLNLEGALEGEERKSKLHILTHNQMALWPALSALNVKAVSLANNHVFDRGNGAFSMLCTELERHGISRFGAGHNLDEALQPAILLDQCSDPLILMGFGCAHEMCPPAGKRRPGVAPLIEDLIHSQIMKWRDRGRIILQLHWGHELESLPLPFHRGLAHRLAKSGVTTIIGHHAHVIQSWEIVNGVPVYFGLGNFFFSSMGPAFDHLLKKQTFGMEVLVHTDSGLCQHRIFNFLTLQEENNNLAPGNLENVPTGPGYEAYFDTHRTSSHKPRLDDGKPIRNALVWTAFRMQKAIRRTIGKLKHFILR